VPGGREAGSALASHKDVAMIALIGSVPTGRAVMKAASDTLKAVMLELGGKNALIAYSDADADEVADGVIGGMNFTWCGQSCGSTSRAFIHEKIYEAVLAKVKAKITHYKPGVATDPATTMGSIISKAQYERILGFIDSAKQEGARLLTGGGRPSDPALAKGFFIEPTVFADVQPSQPAQPCLRYLPASPCCEHEDPRRFVSQATASLTALTGRARTALLAGLAANVCGCLVKGLMPWRALVAGFFTTRNLAKPGIVKTPFFFSSLWATSESASRMLFTCLRDRSPVASTTALMSALLLMDPGFLPLSAFRTL